MMKRTECVCVGVGRPRTGTFLFSGTLAELKGKN